MTKDDVLRQVSDKMDQGTVGMVVGVCTSFERICFVQDPDGTWRKASGDECKDLIGTCNQ